MTAVFETIFNILVGLFILTVNGAIPVRSRRRWVRLGIQVRGDRPALTGTQVDDNAPRCPCGHLLVFHNLETNKCIDKVRQVVKTTAVDVVRGSRGEFRGYETSPVTETSTTMCPCQRYMGPKPPEDIINEWAEGK